MTDLTEMTADELLKRCAEYQPIYTGSKTFDEIRRRLERLEKCEETLHKSQRIEKEGIQAIASAAKAEKRLEWLEELSGTRAAVITEKDKEIRNLNERLEKCEAILRNPDSSIINLVAEAISEQQGCSSCAGSEPTGPHCKACTNEARLAVKVFCAAARAAVEGK